MQRGRTTWRTIIIDDLLDSNWEEMEADVSESLKKVTSYTLIIVLLCSYQLLLYSFCPSFLLGSSSISQLGSKIRNKRNEPIGWVFTLAFFGQAQFYLLETGSPFLIKLIPLQLQDLTILSTVIVIFTDILGVIDILFSNFLMASGH